MVTDNYTERDQEKDPKEPDLYLRIANCRGRKPVMRDLLKAHNLIVQVRQEINPNEAKTILQGIESKLWAIIHDKSNQ